MRATSTSRGRWRTLEGRGRRSSAIASRGSRAPTRGRRGLRAGADRSWRADRGRGPGALLLRDPGDALLAATALRLANKTGDTDVATRARATLTALGSDVHPSDDTKKRGAAF